MKQSTPTVVFTSDKAYFTAVQDAINSIINLGIDCEIILVTDDILSVPTFYKNIQVIYYDMQFSKNTKDNHDISTYYYTCLMLSMVLPKQKIIYLDSDIIINKDVISILWDIDLYDNHTAAFCAHGGQPGLPLGYTSTEAFMLLATFCMVMNLDEWRSKDISAMCYDYIVKSGFYWPLSTNYGDVPIQDQTVLNSVIKGDFMPITIDYESYLTHLVCLEDKWWI